MSETPISDGAHDSLDEVRRAFAALGPGSYGEATARVALAALQLRVVEQQFVASAEEAVASLEELGRPLVLKGATDEVLHKSDAGLVLLGLDAADAVREGFLTLESRLRAACVARGRIAAQQTAPDGIDMFVGTDRDETFGPVVLLGFGGVSVELDRDVARRLAPIRAPEAMAMLRSLRQFPLLDGFRGRPRFDLEELCRLVATVSALAEEAPELTSLDLNPVRVLTGGPAVVLDARLTLSAVPEPPSSVVADTGRLSKLFDPSSIAVIGASRDETRPGGRVVSYLTRHGYAGRIYPVNPGAESIAGLPAYPSLSAVPEVPELACIALAAEPTVDAVREASQLGVGAIIAFASGFAETGQQGTETEQRLREALSPRTAFCGPNTIGVVNVRSRLTATFSQALEVPTMPPGPVAFISQSGAVGGSLVSREFASGYGLSHWVTVGNEVQLSVVDYLEYLLDADGVRAVAVFLEGVSDGQRFRRCLQRARDLDVPVVLFKTGASPEGAAAVRSHSAVLAGRAEVYAAAIAQDGATEVEEMTALLEVAYVLAGPRAGGASIAVVTTSGGAGSATADLIVSAGLRLAGFARDTRTQLRATLPALATVANPLDVTAEGAFKPGAMEHTVGLVAADTAVDIVCVVLTSLAGEDAVRVAAEVGRAARTTGVPVLVTWLLDTSLTREGRSEFVAAGLRVFDEPARMVRAARALFELSSRRDTRSATNSD